MAVANLGLFVPGHLHAERLGGEVAAAAGGPLAAGHGTWRGRPYTRLLPPGALEHGFAILEGGAEPLPWSHPERRLGRALSARVGVAAYLLVDEGRGFGGHALFRDGRLVSLVVVDGRRLDPVLRTLDGERVLGDLDPGEWVWPLLCEAVAQGAAAVVGPGVEDEDAFRELVAGAAPPASHPEVAGPVGSQVRPQDPPDRRLLRGLLQRGARRVRGRGGDGGDS